jgi:Nitrous oxide-stimulated promoter
MTTIELTNTHPRMTREARTLEAMIGIYCRDRHGTRGDDLCPDCADLLSYAGQRLEKCPFQEHKTTCAKCPVHCYKPARREQIRAVMRYAGPRMMFRHPVLAFYHLVIDGRREEPEPKRRPLDRSR